MTSLWALIWGWLAGLGPAVASSIVLARGRSRAQTPIGPIPGVEGRVRIARDRAGGLAPPEPWRRDGRSGRDRSRPGRGRSPAEARSGPGRRSPTTGVVGGLKGPTPAA